MRGAATPKIKFNNGPIPPSVWSVTQFQEKRNLLLHDNLLGLRVHTAAIILRGNRNHIFPLG
jgi:hypothetical protein